jgi:thiamine-phosphate pyrophosphorylase
MDQRLLAWGRAVKQRRRSRFPVLWLFTDAARLPDPLPAIARLPPGLCGVVFRHDGVADRAALGMAVARLCRARRLGLVVAGDVRLAARLKAGLHLRGGKRAGLARHRSGLTTSSAHDVAQVVRGRRTGAQILFISPVFASASHPGQPALGAVRWARLARLAGSADAYALGGINGRKVNALASFCCGAAGIQALNLSFHSNVI